MIGAREVEMTTTQRSCRLHLVCRPAGRYRGRALASAASPSTPTAAAPLTIAGDVATPLTLTPAELKAMPRTTVEVKDEDGRPVKYEGVLVGELLKRAGATLGGDLRGNAITTYVLASATDGYQVLFSLRRTGPASRAHDVIVADTIDGKPLFDYQGPLRIVSPRDARPARSIRMLQRLDVVRLNKCTDDPDASRSPPRCSAQRWRRAGCPRRRRIRGRCPPGFHRPPFRPTTRCQRRRSARPASLLRHASLRQRHAVVQQLSRAGPCLYGRPCAERRLDG